MRNYLVERYLSRSCNVIRRPKIERFWLERFFKPLQNASLKDILCLNDLSFDDFSYAVKNLRLLTELLAGQIRSYLITETLPNLALTWNDPFIKLTHDFPLSQSFGYIHQTLAECNFRFFE
ncbi:hypothetical protein TKK_0016007 [Trichogramma kaykai]